jgi:folate-binding protein YgfZ
MNDWTTFLHTEASELAYSGDTQLADLSPWGLLTVKGPDTVKFLQGQLSCDVQTLQNNIATLVAHCTHQGRAISCFRAFMLNPEAVALSMPRAIMASASAALAKYIVFSKADIDDTNTEFCGIGLAGPKAATLIESLLGHLPAAIDEVSHSPKGYVIQLSEQRFECWLAQDTAVEFWREAAAQSVRASHNDWRLMNIQAGTPELQAETVETFIPQMLNLQALGGVNFHKGCYTGQEVVARMEYRGKLKRPMYRIGFDLSENEALPSPGQALFATDKNQAIGNIVIAATAGENKGEALAVLTSSSIEAGDTFLDEEKSKKLTILNLPYAIKNDI